MFVGSAVPSAGAAYTVVALLNVAESLEYKASLQALPAGVPPYAIWMIAFPAVCAGNSTVKVPLVTVLSDPKLTVINDLLVVKPVRAVVL